MLMLIWCKFVTNVKIKHVVLMLDTRGTYLVRLLVLVLYQCGTTLGMNALNALYDLVATWVLIWCYCEFIECLTYYSEHHMNVYGFRPDLQKTI